MSGQVVSFLTRHLGYPIASPALFEKIGTRFRDDVRRFAADHAVPVVRFAKGDRKIDVMRPLLAKAAATGRSQVVAVGVAPQLAGGPVPHDLVAVVVAVQTQRLAELGIGRVVAGEAGQVVPVRAGGVEPVGPARVGPAVALAPVGAGVAFDGPGVDGPKLGAVNVANTVGCPATDADTPLPPTMPARMSW